MAAAACLVVVGCGGANSGAATRTLPLPVVAQPPDPCHLLTVAEVSSAIGTAVGEPKDAPLATAASPQRVCFWSGHPRGFVYMTIRTQAAEHARSLVEQQAVGHAVYETTMARLFDALPKTQPIAGVGDRAHFLGNSNADAWLEVLQGEILIDLHVQQAVDPGAVAEHLAHVVLSTVPGAAQ
jgi:hypothetical protein